MPISFLSTPNRQGSARNLLRVYLLQRKAVELQEQHDEIKRQLNSYKQLVRIYRGVYESETGVDLQNILPSQIMEILEKKLVEEETSSRRV